MSVVKQKRKAAAARSSQEHGLAPAAFVSERPEKATTPKGRPCTYTEALAAEICGRMAGGETLRGICRDPNMPPPSTVRQWVVDDREGFAERYARARGMLVECLADELLEIADDATNDWMLRAGKGKDGEDASPGWIANGENVNRSRLRADTRKWLISRLKPEVYGDRLSAELSGPGGGPIELDNINKLDVARRVASLLHAGLTEPSDAN